MKRVLWLAMLCLAVLTGCKKSDEPGSLVQPCTLAATTPATARQWLPGDWNWLETRYESRGGSSVSTPASTGINRRLSFKNDGTVSIYANSALEGTYRYEVTGNTAPELSLLDDAGESEGRFSLKVCEKSLEITDLQSSVGGTAYFSKQR